MDWPQSPSTEGRACDAQYIPDAKGSPCVHSTPDKRGNAQTRQLHKRQLHFRATNVPSRDSTLTHSLPFTRTSVDNLEHVRAFNHSRTPERGAYRDYEVLREIDNPKTRRNRKDRLSPQSVSLSENAARHDTTPPSLAREQLDADQRIQATYSDPVLKPVFNRSNTLVSHSRRRRGKANHLATSHYSEMEEYLEHLELELVSAQTQIQSLMSPSTTRVQSAKLRAITSETNTLKREISEWETRFQDRVAEQAERLEMIIHNLKNQVHCLEREAELRDDKLRESEMESAERYTQLVATEKAKSDLEHRLETMAGLLAESPTKLRAQDERERQRQFLKRPKSFGVPLGSPPCSFRHPDRTEQDSPPLSRSQSLFNEDSILSPQSRRESTQSSLSVRTDISESTLVESSMISPTRSRPTSEYFQQQSAKPKRRMRRFQAGAAGPRALILPNTTSGSSLAISAPVSSISTPHENIDSEFPLLESRQSRSAAPNASRSPIWESYRAPLDDDDLNLEVTRCSRSDSQATTIPEHHETSSVSGDTPSSSNKHSSIKLNSSRSLGEELRRVQYLGNRSASSSYGSTSTSYNTLGHRLPRVCSKSKSPATFPIISPTSVQSYAKVCRNNLQATAFKTRTKLVLRNTWYTVTLSQPVLEFRLWLVKILLSDLDRKRGLCGAVIKPPEEARSTSIARGMGLRLGVGRTWLGMANSRKWEGRVDKILPNTPKSLYQSFLLRKGKNRNDPPDPPPVEWLKLSLTLLFAIGVALKDGPSSLFTYTTQDFELDEEHDSASMYND